MKIYWWTVTTGDLCDLECAIDLCMQNAGVFWQLCEMYQYGNVDRRIIKVVWIGIRCLQSKRGLGNVPNATIVIDGNHTIVFSIYVYFFHLSINSFLVIWYDFGF
eukprot:1101862_1